MRQVVMRRHGPPDVLQVREVPERQPGAGELRIRVRAAGVNFADLLARQGLYPGAPKPPAVLGYEVAGHVDAVGPGVAGFSSGDRVVAVTPFGGYADQVVAASGAVFPTPPDLSDAEAAAIPVNYLTAAVALYKLANLAPGETVLVHSAAGGVGTAAVQLARLRRARIIGVASGAKLAALQAFGVDHPLDAHTSDTYAEVMRITAGRGVDVVLDPLGGRSFRTSYRMLAPLGRLVLYGAAGIMPGERRSILHVVREQWAMPRFSPMRLIFENRGVFGLHLGRLWGERHLLAPTMQMLLAEFRAGRLKPVVARTFPLEAAAEAHRFIHARQNIGKVVLTT
jgi:NADPH:quinone reductase-like Zn-dependent oxidoreductase